MLNKSIYMGRLVADPELKTKQNDGREVVWCPFRIAVQRDYKKDGNAPADYITCIAYGNRAKYITRYGKKAYKILVEGRTETGNYVGKHGQKVYTSQLVVTAAWILEYRPVSGQQEPVRKHSPRQEPSAEYEECANQYPEDDDFLMPDGDIEIPEEEYGLYDPEEEEYYNRTYGIGV